MHSVEGKTKDLRIVVSPLPGFITSPFYQPWFVQYRNGNTKILLGLPYSVRVDKDTHRVERDKNCVERHKSYFNNEYDTHFQLSDTQEKYRTDRTALADQNKEHSAGSRLRSG